MQVNKKIGILILCIGILVSGCNIGAKAKPINLTYPSVESKKTEPVVFWEGNNELKKTFEQYWAFRFDTGSPIKELFLMEAPYFQEMVDESFYKVYMRSGKIPKVDEMKVHQVVKKTPTFYEIALQLNVTMQDGEKRDSYLMDYWVKVKGKWYHVIIDDPFFKI